MSITLYTIRATYKEEADVPPDDQGNDNIGGISKAFAHTDPSIKEQDGDPDERQCELRHEGRGIDQLQASVSR